jgi:neutral trehalase
MPWQVHNVYIPPIASVSLASFLHLDALLLADFAVKLGHTDDAAAWRERAAFLAERLEAVCWHDEDGFYYDFDHHVGEHNRVRTHLVFWPLWAGVSMDAERKRRLIEDVLLDPNQFNGPVPFPTCAFDDPNYDPESYWSGRSWPHITYWLIELLAREGYEAEARRAGGRWLAWQSAHTGQREAVTTNPHLTEHAEGGDFTYRTGRDFDYNWAAAAVALLREERYRTFVPLGRV